VSAGPPRAAIGAGICRLEQARELDVVPERLRHLLAVHHDETVVHPVPGKWPVERDHLGAFVLVVRKDQVQSPAVQVESLPEERERHHDAFGVPARTSGPER
jgi:hypothetical protein